MCLEIQTVIGSKIKPYIYSNSREIRYVRFVKQLLLDELFLLPGVDYGEGAVLTLAQLPRVSIGLRCTGQPVTRPAKMVRGTRAKLSKGVGLTQQYVPDKQHYSKHSAHHLAATRVSFSSVKNRVCRYIVNVYEICKTTFVFLHKQHN